MIARTTMIDCQLSAGQSSGVAVRSLPVPGCGIDGRVKRSQIE